MFYSLLALCGVFLPLTLLIILFFIDDIKNRKLIKKSFISFLNNINIYTVSDIYEPIIFNMNNITFEYESDMNIFIGYDRSISFDIVKLIGIQQINYKKINISDELSKPNYKRKPFFRIFDNFGYIDINYIESIDKDIDILLKDKIYDILPFKYGGINVSNK